MTEGRSGNRTQYAPLSFLQTLSYRLFSIYSFEYGKRKNNIDWSPAVQFGVAIALLLGANIPMWLHLDNQQRAAEKRHEEMMSDFHGKLERQDAEFKAYLAYHNGMQK